MAEPLLAVRSLEVVYGHAIRAIRGVSLEVPEGAIVGLIGLNGAGKTTTIRAISGFLRTESVHITDGDILFRGRSIRGCTPYEAAASGIALVPERDKVFDTLTVEENLQLSQSLGQSGPAARQRFSLGDIYGLFPRLAERARSLAVYLSGGERQVLAIASCMLTAPTMLLVDEASLGLAPAIRQHILEQLVLLNRQLGLSILIVDQDVAGVLDIAKHAYIIENGSVVFEGTSEQLRAHGDVKEFYLGRSDSETRTYRDVKQYRRVRRWY